MTQITKRGLNKITTHYGMTSYYDYYASHYEKKVSRRTYNNIVGDFNKEVIELILNEGVEYRLPVLGLTLSVKKEKRTPRIKDGKLYNPSPIDWVTTRKLWKADEESRKNKLLVRYVNHHTSGYVFRIFLVKFGARLKNRSIYKFRTSRYFQRALGKRLKDTNKDKFDCYLLYKKKHKL
jgi:hypothetical protein